MPSIIGQAEQQQALKEISAMLKELISSNDFLSSNNPTGKYTIVSTDSEGQKHTCILSSENKAEVDTLVLNYKEHLKQKIVSLTEQYRIGLEPWEQSILDNNINPPEALQSGRGRKKKTEDAVEASSESQDAESLEEI